MNGETEPTQPAPEAPSGPGPEADPIKIIDELLAKLHEHMPSHAEADSVAEDVNKRLGRKPEEPAAEEAKWSTPEAQKAFEEGLGTTTPRVEPSPEEKPAEQGV